VCVSVKYLESPLWVKADAHHDAASVIFPISRRAAGGHEWCRNRGRI